MDSNNNERIIPLPSRSLPTSPTKAAKSTKSNMTAQQHQKQQAHQAHSNNNTATGGMDGILAERMAAGGGALCNDLNGDCLGYRGNMNMNTNMNTNIGAINKSGIFTSIAKLAMQLDSTGGGSHVNNNNSNNGNGGDGNNNNEVPLVSIQTDSAALLVKDYGGRTVVFRVPVLEAPGNANTINTTTTNPTAIINNSNNNITNDVNVENGDQSLMMGEGQLLGGDGTTMNGTTDD